MSSDTSPPSGYRLENPARTAGGAGGAAPGRQGPSDPSWLKVIGTTIRLWMRRRVLHVPDSGKILRSRRARLAAFAAIVVVVAAGGLGAAVAARSPAPSSRHQHAAAPPKLTPAQAAAALATGKAVATWIATQAGRGLVIGCDPATCAAISAAGYPAGGQVVLQPGVGLPGPGSLIVASAAVRAQYGSQLVSSAPAVIATFGTGAQAVQIRLTVPGGAQAYSQAAASALAARRRAGHKLLQHSDVHVRGALRSDLTSGRVDPRLTTVLRRLASYYPVYVLHFSDAGPLAGGSGLASGSLPFRKAVIAVPSARPGQRTARELGAMEKLLRKQPAGYRAELTATRLAGGKHVLEITFPAPSPV